MTHDFLQVGHGQVAYLRFGHGPELLLCLHGFGDRAQLFEVLAPALQQRYTVYAIDLPFHGHTRWSRDYYTLDDLLEVVRTIMWKEGKQRISLMGYSMGGRLSLVLTEQLADKLDALYLCASDGIMTHRLYDITSLPDWYLQLFKGLLRVPSLFFRLARLAHRSGLLSKFLYDFTYNHFQSPQQRLRFFGTAQSSRRMAPHLDKVVELLNRHQVPVRMFFGLRDEVIRIQGARDLAARLHDARLYELSKGHLLIDQDLAVLLGDIL